MPKDEMEKTLKAAKDVKEMHDKIICKSIFRIGIRVAFVLTLVFWNVWSPFFKTVLTWGIGGVFAALILIDLIGMITVIVKWQPVKKAVTALDVINTFNDMYGGDTNGENN